MATLLWLLGLGVPALLLVGGAVLQNRLAAGRVSVRNAFSGIDVQLKRRHDLVPRLVEVVKGAMAHERAVLERVVEARQGADRALDAAGDGEIAGLAAAEGALESALSAIFIRIEAYPALKSGENVLALQEELVTSENRVAFARHAYNDAAMRFNTLLHQFPSNLVARLLRYEEAALLQWKDADLAAPPSARVESRFAGGAA
jgi:LemA protein